MSTVDPLQFSCMHDFKRSAVADSTILKGCCLLSSKVVQSHGGDVTVGLVGRPTGERVGNLQTERLLAGRTDEQEGFIRGH